MLIVAAGSMMMAFMIFLSAAYEVKELDYLSYASINETLLLSQYVEALNAYVIEYADVPDSLSDLYATSGYEYLASFDDGFVNYGVTTLTGERFTYRKAVLFRLPLLADYTADDFLDASNNQCGTDSFFESATWCGFESALSTTLDNRSEISTRVNENLDRMDMVLQQFSHGHRLNSAFPDENSDGSSITDGSSVNLNDALGISSVSQNCTGSFDFDGTPLDCIHIFDVADSSYIYHRHSDSFMTLYTQLPYLDNSGTNLRYTRSLSIE